MFIAVKRNVLRKRNETIQWSDFRKINDAHCKLKCGLHCHFTSTNIRTQQGDTIAEENEIMLGIRRYSYAKKKKKKYRIRHA